MLTLLDEHTRECLAIQVAWSIRAVDVIQVVARAMSRHGAPEHIRSDNGSEFIAYALRDWLEGTLLNEFHSRKKAQKSQIQFLFCAFCAFLWLRFF